MNDRDIPALDRDDVEVIEKTTPLQGVFRIDRYRLRHRLFEGGWTGDMVREVFERGHAVTVLLYDPERDELVFIEQFRIGAFAALETPWLEPDQSPWLIECVAGIIEDGEDPEDVARREALEEADCEIEDLMPVCRYMASPGGTTETVFAYCGRVDSSDAGGIHGLGDEHENIRVRVLPAADAIRRLDDGRFLNVMIIVVMQWFKLNRDTLRETWLNAQT